MIFLSSLLILSFLKPSFSEAGNNLINTKLNGCDLVVRDKDDRPLREIVVLAQPQSQVPFTYKIGNLWIRDQSTAYMNGDVLVNIEAFPNGNPDFIASLISQGLVTKISDIQPLLLGYSHQNPVPPNEPSRGNNLILPVNPKGGVGPARTLPTPTSTSNFEIVRRYQKAVEGDRLDNSSIDAIARILQNDKEILAKAKLLTDFYEKSAPKVDLSNKGINRYFYFRPNGLSKLVPARVLDISQSRELTTGNVVKMTYKILVEWFDEMPTTSDRIRHVVSLSPGEISTIEASSVPIRVRAQDAFLDSLTLPEMTTIELAKQFQLGTWSFMDFRIADPFTFPITSDTADPLTTMSNVSHRAMANDFLNNFGPIDELLTDEELQSGQWNIIDVFSRQQPDFVLSRLKRLPSEFEFIWAILEDGKLKICPFMEGQKNLIPQLLRLTHGRSIYASGRFTKDSQGRISVSIESRGYTNNEPFSRGHNFRARHQDYIFLPVFVAKTFLSQANSPIAFIDQIDMEQILVKNGGIVDKVQIQWAEYKALLRYRMRNLGESDQVPFVEIYWDAGQPEDYPLSFYYWKERTRRNMAYLEGAERADWAHYVLKTNPAMTQREIKSAFDKLMTPSRFGRAALEDLPENHPALIGFQLAKEALRILLPKGSI